MEWKWVKSFLIFIFVLLNCFLGYQVYQRNRATIVNSESIESVKQIMELRNIKYDFDLTQVETKGYMRKISISNSENIKPEFISMSEVTNDKDLFIGRNRKILSFPVILTNFVRDIKPENITIKELGLGYFPEMSQIDKTVLSGEAIPAWRIVLENGNEYIYNAYLGEKMDEKYCN